MTVENKTNKSGKQVMGSKTYDFSFDILLKDPTEEAAKKAIKCSVSDGTTETSLVYGTDYSVSLNTNRKGGRVTVVDPKNASWTIVIYRSYDETQGSDYNDFDGLSAETLEQGLDKITMILQQHTEELDRSVKVGKMSNADPGAIVGYIERVYGSVDNIDAVANDIDKVNVVAAEQENITTCAENIDAVLEAPVQAQAAQAARDLAQLYATGSIEENPDGSAKHWAQVAEETAVLIGNPADRDLSNLSEAGELKVSKPTITYLED